MYAAAATTEPPGIFLFKCYCIWRTLPLLMLPGGEQVESTGGETGWQAGLPIEWQRQVLYGRGGGVCPHVLRLGFSFQKFAC